MTITAGYDIGGAHLKVARVEGGRLTAVEQFPCPLWHGLDKLDAALAAARALTAGADLHAVTMTGELCELFDSREQGVAALTHHVSEQLGANVRVFMGLKGFGDADAAVRDWLNVASANYLATARAISERRPNALLIDFGSTTTDIVVCDRPQGLTDAERLQTGELVYTGLTRTPVPSVTTRCVLAGQWQTLARDAFATMADVRRVIGDLPEGIDGDARPDGRSTTLNENLKRLARGFGRDGDMRHLDGWRIAAAHIREAQLRSIIDGVAQALSRPGVDVSGGVVAAGIGADDVQEIARRLGLPCITFGELIDAPPDLRLPATRYAPRRRRRAAGMTLLPHPSSRMRRNNPSLMRR